MGAFDVAGTLASVFTPGIDYFQQQSANDTNSQSADRYQQLNAAEAEKNRKWQAQMSNTAAQRAAADLKKAGFNPILAANAGASTPSGGSSSSSAPTANAPTTSTAGLNAAFSTAMDARRFGLEQASTAASIAKAQAETSESKMRTAVLAKDIPKAEIINRAYEAGKEILNKISSPPSSSLNPAGRDYLYKRTQDLDLKLKADDLNKKGHYPPIKLRSY